MKKQIVILACLIMCVFIFTIGCSNSSTNSETDAEEETYADESFVKDMASGLQARWKLVDETESSSDYATMLLNSKENQEYLLECIDSELEYIEKYTDEKFEDHNLQELALRYINLLEEHKELCDYITVDYDKYDTEYQPIYNERSEIIDTLISDYGMTVDEKYEDKLKDFQTNASIAKEEENTEAEIEKMLNSMKFEVVEEGSSGDLKEYEAVLENTTDTDFKTFSVYINLLDDDGVIIDSLYDTVNSFNKGAKAKFSFTTEQDFATVDVTLDWWE